MGVSHHVAPSAPMDVNPVTRYVLDLREEEKRGRKVTCLVLSIFSRDLDQACMEAVAGLLSGLPLQPEESDRGDLNEAKSQLFLK